MNIASAGDSAVYPSQSFTLATGVIDIRLRGGSSDDWPLERLCSFAARRNAKRGFLIVSKVLGRHLPTTPREMLASFEALASRLLREEPDLPGPVLFIGMAETAICLGQGTHAAYRRLSGRSDTLYLHTTRQQIAGNLVTTFQEPHSHASAHLLYAPQADAHDALFAAARSLVLVDDEISTGTTLVNLAQAISPHLPLLERLHTVALTDWSGNAEYRPAMPYPCGATNLLTGQLTWRGDTAAEPAAPAVASANALGRMERHRNFGRLGIQFDPPEVAGWADSLQASPGQRFLILGTGEFTYAPYLVAKALEDAGHEVEVQATTRSPIHIGGAISCALTFADNYETGVPNYLYNVEPEPGRRIVICHETPPGSVDPGLVDRLDAQCLFLGAD